MPATVPKIEKRVEVYAKADCDELYLYGTIGQYGDIQAAEVKTALEKSKSGALCVHINSGGGEVFESVAISNLLKSCGKKISVCVDGLAASGASVIAMAGEKITMHGNAMMMIHNAWTFACGNARELRKVADDLEKIDGAADKTYIARFKGTEDELKTLLDEETWLTAEECAALGFCDEIIDAGGDGGGNSKTEKSAKTGILAKYGPELTPEEISDEQKMEHRANIMGSFLTAFYNNATDKS